MNSNEKREFNQLAEEIVRYLEDHPNAADTTEGIAKWWLRLQGFQVSIESVQEALDYLVAKSLVKRRTKGDGESIYSSITTNQDRKRP